jgi:hypothetical protein
MDYRCLGSSFRGPLTGVTAGHHPRADLRGPLLLPLVGVAEHALVREVVQVVDHHQDAPAAQRGEEGEYSDPMLDLHICNGANLKMHLPRGAWPRVTL